MATVKQKNLAKEVVNNIKREKPLNKGELLGLVGYAKKTQTHKCGLVFEQKGVQEELKELGFDENSAKQVVKEIMLNPKVDPSTRLKATDQVFKVRGSYAPEKKDITGNMNLDADRKILQDILKGLRT